VLAIFGFGAFNLFVTGEPEVATVNGEGITESQLATATERERRRMAAQMGEEFDPGMIDPVRLQGAVLEQLIARRVLGQGAEDLGMRVSRARVDDMLVSNPSFQVDGQFQGDVYRQTVQAMGYTPQSFVEETSEMMALQQLQEGIVDSAFLTRRELNVHAGLLGQRRDIAYLPFEVDRFREQVTVTEDEVRLRYEENQRVYMTEESVDVAYVILSRGDLVDDPSIAIPEDAVRSAYEAERASAPPEQERRSRHILLETGEERTPEQAVATLEEIKARVEGGESFADIAREISEDPGSAADGGDLGFAGPGVLDPAFDEALFALEAPGDVSDPVQTEFGYHLIRLEEVRDHEYPAFEVARADIERRLRREEADALYAERLRELDNLAFEQPDGLATIEERLGLAIQSTEGVTREAGPPPFDDPQVRERLFTGDVLDRRFNSAAAEIGEGRAVVMRVTDRHEPEPISFEEVADAIRDEIETERARALAQEAFDDARSRLESGESVSDVATAHEVNWQTFELVRRNAAEVPRAVVQEAFLLPRPGADGKSIGQAALPAGGIALVTVTRVRDGQVDALTEAELNGMRTFLADRTSRLEFAALFETLREAAAIRRADQI
jgi:peptidyl-prolyl cis-trans isomerase D